MHSNIIKKDDTGVPVELDTELEDFSGYVTLKIEFWDPDGALAYTATAADGGAGPVGQLLTYTTGSSDPVFNARGEWELFSRLEASGVVRRGAYPVKVMVVE